MAALTTAEKSASYRAKDVEAYRAKKREYAKTPEQMEKRTEYMKRYREKNRESYNAMCRESHRRNRSPEKSRNGHLKYTYGITLAQFNEMLKAQGGKCLICGTDKPPGKKPWHVDHCHDSGKVRGILCCICNPALGWFERNAEAAQRYLDEGKFGPKGMVW